MEVSSHYRFIFVVAIMFPSLVFYALMKRNSWNPTRSMRSINSVKMINFCKNAACPTSQGLLAFQKGEALKEEGEVIRGHLPSCEFCATEVEFYARYPFAEEPSYTETKIPLPLYQLAEALLSNRQKKFTLLNKLLSENESLTLEKA